MNDEKFKNQMVLMIRLLNFMTIAYVLLFIFRLLLIKLELINIIIVSVLFLLFLYFLQFPLKRLLEFNLEMYNKNSGWIIESKQIEILISSILVIFLFIIVVIIIMYLKSGEYFFHIFLIGFLIYLLFSINYFNKYKKKRKNWETKSFKKLNFTDTVNRIEKIFLSKGIKFKKEKFVKTNKFNLLRYDYSYELPNNVILTIFFPIKKKRTSKVGSLCKFHIGSLDNKKRKIFEKYKKLLDSEFN